MSFSFQSFACVHPQAPMPASNQHAMTSQRTAGSSLGSGTAGQLSTTSPTHHLHRPPPHHLLQLMATTCMSGQLQSMICICLSCSRATSSKARSKYKKRTALVANIVVSRSIGTTLRKPRGKLLGRMLISAPWCLRDTTMYSTATTSVWLSLWRVRTTPVNLIRVGT